MRAILDEASSPPKPKPQENESDFPVKEDDKDIPEPLHEFPDKKGEDPDGRPPARMVKN